MQVILASFPDGQSIVIALHIRKKSCVARRWHHVDTFIVLELKRLVVSSWSASVSRTIKISTWSFQHCLCFCVVAGTAYSNAYFGSGSGPIFLDDVQCTSSSSQLLECSSRPILSHDCLHSADAGVGCEGMVHSMNIVNVFLPSSVFSMQPSVQMVSCVWLEAT